MIVAAALLLVATADDDAAVRARASEEAAFAAVGEKRWCDALALFLDADRLAPTPDLVFNAAQAAELGADRARAMQLYTQLLGTTTSAARKTEAKGRIAALTKLVEKGGPGTPCPLPAPPSAVPTAAASAPAPAAPTPAPPSRDEPAAPPPSTPWPWVTAGVGGAAVLAGAALAVVGAQPWFAHGAARDALAAAEKQGATDGVDGLYAAQQQARADWVGWGQASLAAGLAFAAVGVVAAAGGAVWGLTSGGAE
ncbi:MAG: hypothetical protein HYS27_01180 [Deltaproteobacteria bacterium]|nr:hypothetical protein [Deltaproteobacteria bacterium]